MKIKTNRLIASGLMSLVFILELFILHGLFEQVGSSSLAIGHLFVVYGMFLVPVFAVLIGNPVFEKAGVKYAVVYSMVLYVCATIFFFGPANTLYNAGLTAVFTTMNSTVAGYYVVAAKVVLMLAALVIAIAAPKEKSIEEAKILESIEAGSAESDAAKEVAQMLNNTDENSL